MVASNDYLEYLIPPYLIDSSRYYVLVFGENGALLFANQKTKKAYPNLFSCSTEPEFWDILHHGDVSKLRDVLNESHINESGSFTVSLRRLDTNLVDFTQSSWEFRQLKEAGNVEGFIGIGHDILDKNPMDVETSTSEKQFYEAIIHQTGDCYFQLDKAYRIVALNEPAARAMGASREELMMKNLWEVHPEFKEFTYPDLLQQAMTQNHPLFFNEYDAQNDTWYQVSLYSSAMGITVLFRDVTEDKHKNDEAVKANVVLKSVLESTHDCFFLINRDKRIQSFNKTAQKCMTDFFRRSIQEGDDFGDCIQLMKTPEFGQALDDAFNKGTIELEREISILSGKSYWFLFKFSPIPNACGLIDHVAFTCKNIDQKKRYYLQLEKKNKVLREMAYNQSHVIRSPLSSILGLLGLIDGSELSQEDKELFDMLKPLAEQLDHVIKDNVKSINQLEE